MQIHRDYDSKRPDQQPHQTNISHRITSPHILPVYVPVPVHVPVHVYVYVPVSVLVSVCLCLCLCPVCLCLVMICWSSPGEYEGISRVPVTQESSDNRAEDKPDANGDTIKLTQVNGLHARLRDINDH